MIAALLCSRAASSRDSQTSESDSLLSPLSLAFQRDWISCNMVSTPTARTSGWDRSSWEYKKHCGEKGGAWEKNDWYWYNRKKPGAHKGSFPFSHNYKKHVFWGLGSVANPGCCQYKSEGKSHLSVEAFLLQKRRSHVVTSFLKTQKVHVLFSAGIDLLCTNG